MIRRLARRVLDKVRGPSPTPSPSPRGAPPAPPAAPPAPVAAAETLSRMEAGAQEVKERIDAGEPVVLLDVRQPEETAQGVIAGAVLIPLAELATRWEEVKDCDEIVCYCAAGMRSLRAAELLRSKGVFNATSMEGGVMAWKQAGGSLGPAPGAKA